MNRRTTTLLALILLAIVAFLLWNPSPTTTPDAAGSSTRASSADPTHWSSGTSKFPSKLPRTLRPQTPHATHAPDELKDFIIPTLETRDATLDEALTSLFEQYNEICHNTGETPVTFTYRIKGEPDTRLDLQLRQVSFLKALRVIAARAGLVLERDGTRLVFSSIALEPSDSLKASTSPVPPTFLGDLRALFVTAPAVPEDPFAQADTTNTTKPGRSSIDFILDNPLRRAAPSLLDQLRHLGIVRSSNATASYVPGSSTLVLKSSPADQARLTAFLESELLNTRPVQLKTTTKFIESSEPITFEMTQFSDEEFQKVMRSLSQKKGASILTQPIVVSRPGQPATIEVGREVVILDPDNAGDFTKDWIGLKMQINSGGYGFDLQSNITNEIRETMGDTPDTIKGVTADSSQHHPAGHTVLIESTSPSGLPLYLFATTQRIDATGRPYDPRNPEESP